VLLQHLNTGLGLYSLLIKPHNSQANLRTRTLKLKFTDNLYQLAYSLMLLQYLNRDIVHVFQQGPWFQS
jgi:hypothetical protein